MERRAARQRVQECESAKFEELVVLWTKLAVLGVAFLLGDVVVAGTHNGAVVFPVVQPWLRVYLV